MKTKLQENLQGITTKRPSENFVKTQLMQLVISPTVPPNSFLTEFDYSSKTLVSLGLLNSQRYEQLDGYIHFNEGG